MMNDIVNHLDALRLNLDYIQTLSRYITEYFMNPLVNGDIPNDILVKIEGPHALNMTEMVAHYLNKIDSELEAIEAEINAAKRNRHNTTRAEQIDEIMNEINKSVGVIEQRDDWRESLKYLSMIASALSQGYRTHVSVTQTDTADHQIE